MQITNPNPAYAYPHPVYVNWAAACLAMLESGVDESTIREMSAYAQHLVEVSHDVSGLGSLHSAMPVQVERIWQPRNLLAGKGRWDVTNYIANPDTGRVDRLCVMLPA